MPILPEQLAEDGSESSHQKALMQWIALSGAKRCPEMAHVFSVPNGGDRRPSVAAAMKAEGVRRGVPDLFWPWSPAIGLLTMPPGLWVELKTPKHAPKSDNKALFRWSGGDDRFVLRGGRSDEQVEWHLRLRDWGWPVVTAYGWCDAAWALWSHASGNLRMPSGGDCFHVHGAHAPPF